MINFNNVKNTISTKDKTEIISSNIIQEKGIDVSSYQDSISWEKVSKSNIKFAILRSTIKDGSLDTKFIQNYNVISFGTQFPKFVLSYRPQSGI